MNTDDALDNSLRPALLWRRLWQAIGIAAALPFLFGAISLTAKLVGLPSAAGYLSIGQLLGSALFAFGISLGLLGSTFALSSHSTHTRTLWSALTLFGCSHVVLGVVVRRTIQGSVAGSGLSIAPFLLPAALWALSVLLAIKAHGGAENPGPAAQNATEEQQPPLSQP